MAYNWGGVSQRSSLAGARSGQVEVRVDDGIMALQERVGMLKQEATMEKAKAAVKNTMKRMKITQALSGGTHLVHVILFALACFFFFYMYIKFRRS
eukprot:jgi/Mesen1/2259/ME000153S01476